MSIDKLIDEVIRREGGYRLLRACSITVAQRQFEGS